MAQVSADGQKVIGYLLRKVRKLYGDRRPRRIFHAKSIGLVEAELIVAAGLEPELQIGLFAAPGKYTAWIRFTNGSKTVSPDGEKTVRGMAIKILGVEGTPCTHATQPGMQDLVLSTSRTFSPGSGPYALSGVTAALGTGLAKAAGAVRVFLRYFSGSILFIRKASIQTPDILEENYYSGTPYAFGSRAVKWYARPIKTITSVMPEHPAPDFLHTRLMQALAKKAGEKVRDPVGFDLFVQFQHDEHTEPIDDSTVVWRTPFKKVARINIPPQQIDGPERERLDLTMSFCPGNALLDHQPLGTINRVRVDAYRAMAKDRDAYPIEKQMYLSK
jgi:hypothetical protein